MADENGKGGIATAVKGMGDHLRNSQVWNSIFRPGSPARVDNSDSPRNRAYVVMNNVLYHLHPVKVKRHGVKLSYTMCLGGLSFFLFILLTVTGIFLMFYYRPTSPQAYFDLQALATDVAFGQLVRGARCRLFRLQISNCNLDRETRWVNSREEFEFRLRF